MQPEESVIGHIIVLTIIGVGLYITHRIMIWRDNK